MTERAAHVVDAVLPPGTRASVDAHAQGGTVESATVLPDRLSGDSLGFGFVQMRRR